MKTLARVILGCALILAPIAGFAAIDNTHHDTIYLISSLEKCAYCHAKQTGGADTSYGKVGSFCVQVCHIGTAVIATPRPEVVPDNVGAFAYNEAGGALTYEAGAGGPTILNNAHGFDVSNLTLVGEADTTPVTGTNWPHVNESTQIMECTSCHAVHDNTNPPFLNANYNTFCETCHPSKVGAYTAASGNHPIAMDLDSVTALSYTGVLANAKSGDAATLMNARQLRTPGAAGSAAPVNLYQGWTTWGGTPNAAGTSWELGGHVLDATGLPVQGVTVGGANHRFGCYSCHNAHQAPLQTPLDPAISSALTLGGKTVAGGEANLADVCYGCHGDDANENDPGNSGQGHPVNEEALVNTFTVTLSAGYNALGAGYKNGEKPLCVACHDVHGGAASFMAIRDMNGGTADPTSACTFCHETAATADATNRHHPGSAIGTGTDYGAWGFADASWATADGNGAFVTHIGLACQDCHIGDGTADKRSTAHNWL